MHTPTLLHLDGRWRLFEGDTCREFTDAPEPGQPIQVLSDFTGSVDGLASFEGRPDHAAALVEQQLRRGGLTDGETKLLLHRTGRLGKGFQVLYTAVGIEHWQRMLAWVQRHDDHCLVLPALSALAQGLPSGQARLLRAGRRLTVLARVGQRLEHVDVLAFSDEPADLVSATVTLAQRLVSQCGAESEALTLHWYCAGTDSLEDERALMAALSQASGIPCEEVPMQRYRWHVSLHPYEGQTCFAAVPALAALMVAQRALNSWPDRLAWMSERALPWVAAASVLMTVGMLAVSGYLVHQRYQLREDVAALHAQVRQLQVSESTVQAQAPSQALADTQALIRQLHDVAAGDNPASDLWRLQGAAGDDIRILRVRSEPRVGRGTALRVEGVASGAGAQLPRFVERLRAAGYSAQAVDPGTGAGHPTGYFAYRLTRTDVPPEQVALGEARR